MAALVQTIKVVDQSGKAVSTSKHLVNVFKEAKAAYQDRKAEVVAKRTSHRPHGERKQSRAMKVTVEDDEAEDASCRRTRRYRSSRPSSPGSRRSSLSIRTVAGSNGSPRSPGTIYPSSENRFSRDLIHSAPPSPGLPRSSTSPSIHTSHHDLSYRRPVPNRSRTSPDIDMALAYGDLPPTAASGPLACGPNTDDQELQPLVGKVKRILEEADCLQYSATTIMASLQKNPEAMAAVALTLAEISNLISKMAPGAVMALKGSAPAVFALLISPQFLIAGGVALGVTVVAFGGYKIIQKIKAKREGEREGEMEEMMEFGPAEMGSIDAWRRGISAAGEGGSAGTSVDGEYITPQAHALSRLNLADSNEVSTGTRRGMASSVGSSGKGAKHGPTRAQRKSEKHERKSEKKASERARKDGEKAKKDVKVKKPSPLRLMLR